jgi:hypothetical protein
MVLMRCLLLDVVTKFTHGTYLTYGTFVIACLVSLFFLSHANAAQPRGHPDRFAL